VIEPPSQATGPSIHFIAGTFWALAPKHVGREEIAIMVQTPLAFDFSKTRTICDAFDDASRFLQARGSDFTEASNSLATRTVLAKRIIEMADHGLTDVRKLRDDALAFFNTMRPRLIAKGSGRSIGAQQSRTPSYGTKRWQPECECVSGFAGVRFYGAERTRYARAKHVAHDFAYHWPHAWPADHACCRGLGGLLILPCAALARSLRNPGVLIERAF